MGLPEQSKKTGSIIYMEQYNYGGKCGNDDIRYEQPLKGMVLTQALKGHRIVRQPHYYYKPPLKRPVFMP